MSVPTRQGLVSCPSCGAAVRLGSDWCTLCFTDLRPVPPPVPSAPLPVTVVPVPAAADEVTGAAAATTKTIPCRWCRADMSPLADICPTCGAGLFDGLAREGRAAVTLPLVGDVMRFSRNARMAGAAVGSTMFAGILVSIVAVAYKLF